jgi:ribonuclease R
VTSFGCFIQLDNYFVDGLLHVRNLKGHFVYDEHTMSLVASRSGERFSIGDRLRIVIANTSPAKGQIDFELVERLPAHSTDESFSQQPSED